MGSFPLEVRITWKQNHKLLGVVGALDKVLGIRFGR
jgi:hypothetical protein